MPDRTTEIIDAIDELVDWQLTLREGSERPPAPTAWHLFGPGRWIRRLLLVGPHEAAELLLVDESPWEIAHIKGRYAKRARNVRRARHA